MKKNTFPKRLRLLSNEEFKAVISKKNRFADDVLVIYYSQNTREFSRLGITIGKSAGGAVERNRFKRLAREVFRQNRRQLPTGLDYVIMKARNAKKPQLAEITQSFLKLVRRIES